MTNFKSGSTQYRGFETSYQTSTRNFSKFSLMLFLFFLFACDKQEAIPDIDQSTNPFATIQQRSVSNIADRVYFVDFEEFMDYYDYLDSLYVLDLDVFDSIILADSPVQTINDLYSASFDYETFLADPIIRGILNPDYEFQIGDAIISYINNAEVLVFDVGNSAAKSAIRSFTRGEPIDIEEIPSGAYWGRPDDIENAIRIGCGCRLYIRPWTDCENVRVWGSCNSFWGSDGDGELIVEYDDIPLFGGIQVLDEDVSGNFSFLLNTTLGFLYQNDGFFFGTVDPRCVLAENVTAEYYFDPATFAGCDERHMTASDIIENGNERMKIGTSFWVNNWGYACHKAEIRSQSRSNGSSPWGKSRAELDVNVAANILTLACDFIDDKDDDADCNNCFSRATVVRWLNSEVAHCEGDLIGDYRKEKSSIILEEEQIVEFECCE